MKYYKSYSQNFFCNSKLINKIYSQIKPIIYNKFLEIGSGMGSLTYNLIFNYKKYNLPLISVEIDKRFYFFIKKNKILNIINLNILNLNLFFLKNKIFKKIFIVANIPYSISTFIFFYFINFINLISFKYLMIQHEFFIKMFFNKNHKNYNILSIILNCLYRTKKLIFIKNTFFYPVPLVNSCFLKSTPLYLHLISLNDLKLFQCFLKNFFLKKIFQRYFFLKKNIFDFYINIFFFYKKKKIFFYYIK